MAVKKPIQKLLESLLPLGARYGEFSDKSASWVSIEDAQFEICFTFDGAGKKIEKIMVSKKIYQVVDQKMICKIQTNEAKD